jgi:hypothetical protein
MLALTVIAAYHIACLRVVQHVFRAYAFVVTCCNEVHQNKKQYNIIVRHALLRTSLLTGQ